MANKNRDSKREAFWRGVLKRRVGCGLSVRAFCRRERLSEASFYGWRRTILQRDAEAKAPQRPAFLPVVLAGNNAPGHAILIELAGGRTLRLPELISAQRLAEFVQALEASAPR